MRTNQTDKQTDSATEEISTKTEDSKEKERAI